MSKRHPRQYERRQNGKRKRRPKPQTPIERLLKDAGRLLGSIENGMNLVSQAANDIRAAARQVRSDCNNAIRDFREKRKKVYEADYYAVLDDDEEDE